jgi:hypothetical protein
MITHYNRQILSEIIFIKFVKVSYQGCILDMKCCKKIMCIICNGQSNKHKMFR